MSEHLRTKAVMEKAVLQIRPGESSAFEEAFSRAKSILAGRPGFRRLTLSRSTSRTSTYLLLVWWERIEDHQSGFRESPEYKEWSALLHHFYDPFPAIEYFTLIESG